MRCLLPSVTRCMYVRPSVVAAHKQPTNNSRPPNMAPKDAPPKRVLLGRSRNNVEMGILGLPNVGKSSFFNVLCEMTVPAENFPFCTIDPNTAKVAVPDKRFNFLVEAFKPKSEMSAALAVTDIAGLVRGASEGAGLGNEFLSHVQSVDGLYHICRGFEDEEVTHVEPGPLDPCRDLDIIHNELRLKDLSQVNKFIAQNEKNVERKVGGKELAFDLEVVKKVKELLESSRDVRSADWNLKEIEVLNKFLFITAKPMVYLVNLSKKAYIKKGSKFLPKVVEYVKARGCEDQVLPFSVVFEVELQKARKEGKEAEFLAECEGATSMLPRIIHGGYEVLELIHYFTVGPVRFPAFRGFRAWLTARVGRVRRRCVRPALAVVGFGAAFELRAMGLTLCVCLGSSLLDHSQGHLGARGGRRDPLGLFEKGACVCVCWCGARRGNQPRPPRRAVHLRGSDPFQGLQGVRIGGQMQGLGQDEAAGQDV
jgi:obg-like ATPase 1